MVCCDSMHHRGALAVLLTEFGTNKSVGSLNFVAYSLADVMQ